MNESGRLKCEDVKYKVSDQRISSIIIVDIWKDARLESIGSLAIPSLRLVRLSGAGSAGLI